ncbi:hypothetical protein B0H13DRAFT_1858596 [Mycena leptocephala]|nr:hypothetical protein B0H13DRAFT_1858596 [Mycena leptocephala]
MSSPRKRGRPKGSKDGPRPEGAPARDVPEKMSQMWQRRRQRGEQHRGGNIHHTNSMDAAQDFDASFDAFDAFTEEDWRGVDQAVIDELGGKVHNISTTPRSSGPRWNNSMKPKTIPENTIPHAKRTLSTRDSDTETDPDPDSHREDDNPATARASGSAVKDPSKESRSSARPLAWSTKPKFMPQWLYEYFRDTIQPLISQKEGRKRAQPPSFTSRKSHALPSFWINPPEPVFQLSRYRFHPKILYRPRVFLWLPHFFVDKLCCPNCGKPLEKNGTLSPWRITDLQDSFYIVAWEYYCRKGCGSHFHGWSRKLLDSLPPFLRLAFPATLSRKAGLSRTAPGHHIFAVKPNWLNYKPTVQTKFELKTYTFT